MNRKLDNIYNSEAGSLLINAEQYFGQLDIEDSKTSSGRFEEVYVTIWSPNPEALDHV
ncbi:unnamed protein product [Dovyalis caffra]|uniref:Uncharacterized protein n=1 Tax=Dovyalis caffra TaxID=77055 RepID=A0AAV1RUQ0_9ROSI|nr:unnamed protein product [Dovyalis caffra]CAK7339242.1 unnamed protein product [Dovyalis caffra]CAK7339246.1 unnamed protein product [Dovyalis caffra]